MFNAARIREAIGDKDNLLSGIIAMDKTYVGGRPCHENKKDDDDECNTGSSKGVELRKLGISMS